VRYAENLAAGQGPVFNPGERVEGASDLLWVLVLAGLKKAGLPALASAKAVGVALVAAVPLVAYRAGSSLPGAPLGGLVAAALCALSGPLAFWAGNGLEAGAQASVVLLAVLLGIGDVARARGFPAAAPVFLVAALLRPEGIALSVPYLLLMWGRARRDIPARGPAVAATALLAGGMAAVTAFRLLYYGDPVPNTWWAKEANPALWTLGRGTGYLADFVGDSGGWMVVLLGVLPLARSAPVLLVAGTLAVQVAFIMYSGRDWMEGYRFVVPVVPLLALLVGSGASLAHGALARAMSPRSLGAVSALAFALILGVSVRGTLALDGRMRSYAASIASGHSALAGWLKEAVPAGTLLAIGDGGLVPYLTGFPSVDLQGLTDRFVARHSPLKAALHVLNERRPGILVLRMKVREPAPGVFLHHSPFQVDGCIARDPVLGRDYVFLRAWDYGPDYDLHAYVRRELVRRIKALPHP
jgi:hypothetical protein